MEKLKNYLSNQYGLDSRSIYIFRVLFGMMIIIDILNRMLDLGTFYGDEGVIPRSFSIGDNVQLWKFSFHYIVGSKFGLGVLFFINIFLTWKLIQGESKTKLYLFFVWLFFISIDVKNFLILQSGDNIFRMFSFWILFIPLTNQSLLENKNKKIFNMGVVAFYVQVAIIYFYAGVTKSFDIYFKTGDALRMAMELERYASSLGVWSLNFPEVLKFLSRFSYIFEMLCPVLLLFPFRNWIFRSFILLIISSFHIGTFFMMEIGQFPFIAIVMWLIFIPREVYDRFPVVDKTYLLTFQIIESINGGIKNLWNCFGGLNQKFGRYIVSLFVGFLIVYNLILNAKVHKVSFGKGEFFQKVMAESRFIWISFWFDQRWNMFSPFPAISDGWHSVSGQKLNGQRVNLFGVPFDQRKIKPKSVSSTYPRQRWRKYMERIASKKHRRYRRPFYQYLCRKNNKGKKREDKIHQITHIYMEELTSKIPNQKPSPLKEISIGKYYCFSKPKNNKK